jgi:hypothetical protein
MSRCRRAGLVALLLVVLAPLAMNWLWISPSQLASGSPVKAGAPGQPANSFAGRVAGNVSCSARGCHGGLEANPSPALGQNEYTRWTTHDKHSQAFEVLSSERGQRIAKNLAVTNEGGKTIPANKDVRCLACHMTPQLASVVAASPDRHPHSQDGVGCESCHGPAGNADDPRGWLSEHTRGSWKERKAANAPALFAEYHMKNLGNLQVQAAVCAGCHVGAPADDDHGLPARDLNHDLMAAGHPRLTFELTSFRENMPPHWQKDKHAADPGYEARSWAVGQVMSARASVELLRERAKRAQETTPGPWPEFAEADCFSCHAALRVPSWRGGEYRGQRALGVIPYNTWYTVMLPHVSAGPEVKAVTAGFDELRALMDRPLPDPREVVKVCDKLVGKGDSPLGKLTATVETQNYTPELKHKLLAGICAEAEKRKKAVNWDEAEQTTLAVAALSSPAHLEKARKELEALWQTDLAFPPDRESPAAFRRDDFLKRWDALLSTLPK